MIDTPSVAAAAAAAVMAAYHAVWVNARHLEHAMAGSVLARCFREGNLPRAIKLTAAAPTSVFFREMRAAILRGVSLRGSVVTPTAG